MKMAKKSRAAPRGMVPDSAHYGNFVGRQSLCRPMRWDALCNFGSGVRPRVCVRYPERCGLRRRSRSTKVQTVSAERQ